MTAALKLGLSPRVFAAVLSVAAVAICGAGWFGVIAPKHDQATKLETAIQADQSRLATAYHQARTARRHRRAEQAALDAALPPGVAMPNIVDQLNALADQAGVLLDTVTPGTSPTVGTGYVTVPLTVIVDGRYFAIEKFLRLVRTQVVTQKSSIAASGRLFDVTSVQLVQAEPTPTVTATFQVNAYYYSPGATAPQPASTTDTTTTP